MTWITDHTGTRWVEPKPRKRRAKPVQGRFSQLSVGDQLEERHPSRTRLREQFKREAPRSFYVVTDLWFDPVKGQDAEYSGQMVGYRGLNADGEPVGRKRSTNRHGLATQGFHIADFDYIAQCRARVEAANDGKVVGIGFGKVIRKRPKISGGL